MLFPLLAVLVMACRVDLNPLCQYFLPGHFVTNLLVRGAGTKTSNNWPSKKLTLFLSRTLPVLSFSFMVTIFNCYFLFFPLPNALTTFAQFNFYLSTLFQAQWTHFSLNSSENMNSLITSVTRPVFDNFFFDYDFTLIY